ncbi:unnamed protein product, partial [Ectocarpus sp. 12 AP-2014]
PADAAYATAYAANAAYAATAAANAADAAYTSATTATTATTAIADAAAFWQQLGEDCDILGTATGVDAQAQSLTLLGTRLWTCGEMPQAVNDSWGHAVSYLEDNGLRFWSLWYQRRLTGEASGFALPREQDLILQENLLEQENEWWAGGQKQSDLAQAAEELRVIDEQAVLGSSSDFHRLEVTPEKQFSSVPVFQSNQKHQLSLNFHQGSEALRTDEDATDRHAELLAELHQLKEQCSGSNSLGHVVNLADRLVEALGSEVSEMRTSLVVQRGERIRQLVETYEHLTPASLHEKVDEFVFNQLKATRDALNMAVGLDPVLDKLDRARLGPDIEMSLVSPSEVKERFEELADQEIVTEETSEFVGEAVDLAPTVPDPENRQSRTVDLLAQNFIRYSIEIISVHPQASAWTALGTGLVAATTLGAGTTGAGMGLLWLLAKSILKHENKYRDYVGNSP